ncbi:MAG: type II toxin-antitoxin system RelE/ParE family toxin [Peptococcaceae bacterium]|nr:type II toxin-antitoxin system RelE/ParE family toxin [Peptococcaceae bacterium]
MWEIELYESASGRRPVETFILGLKPNEQAKIARSLDLLEEFGPQIGMPYVKRLEETEGLWELRVPFGGQSYRLLFFVHGSLLVITHAFSQKTSKIPRKEINTAISRMKDYIQRSEAK